MPVNKDLRALIDERLQVAFARETEAMCASLLGIAGTKLERLLAELSAGKIGGGAATNSSARAAQLIALLDQRIKVALDRDMRERCEATADVVRELVDEFKHVRSEIDTRLKQLQTSLAERPPLDPLSQRPN